MKRSSQLAACALIAALCLRAGDVLAARALLNELLIRAPAAAGQPAMTSQELEACLDRARTLDIAGVEVDIEVTDVDRLAAEGMFLQNRINAEIPTVGDYDEKQLKAFQSRLSRHEELAHKFQTDFSVYQKHQQDYNDAFAAFERDCSKSFSASDLEAAKTKLGIK